jgi:hypothetical protein
MVNALAEPVARVPLMMEQSSDRRKDSQIIMPAPAGPFDFSQAMRGLCQDACRRVPEFRHVEMEHVAVTFAQTRRRVLHGLQAKLTPLRFEEGRLTTRRGRTDWTIRRMFDGETELLYILTFYLPRFFELPFREKLITVFHELYHISPEFNGDIRRFGGRYHVHSARHDEYDRQMGLFADAYMAGRPSAKYWAFLQHDFQTLQSTHGQVIGVRMPIPRMIRLPEVKSA